MRSARASSAASLSLSLRWAAAVTRTTRVARARPPPSSLFHLRSAPGQLYKRVDGMEWLTRAIKGATGMTLPIVTAKWGLPQAGLLPIATDIHLRYGAPVDVGAREDNPSDERVKAVFEARAPSVVAAVVVVVLLLLILLIAVVVVVVVAAAARALSLALSLSVPLSASHLVGSRSIVVRARERERVRREGADPKSPSIIARAALDSLRYKRNRRSPARRQSRAAHAAASRRAISSPRAPRKRLCIRARRTRCCLLALPRAPGAPRRSRPLRSVFRGLPRRAAAPLRRERSGVPPA